MGTIKHNGEIFNLNLLIQKNNVTSRRIAYFYCYNTELNKDKSETILASQDETFKQTAAHGDLLIILFKSFLSFSIHDSLQGKRGRSRHYAMHHFQGITPIILLFHSHFFIVGGHLTRRHYAIDFGGFKYWDSGNEFFLFLTWSQKTTCLKGFVMLSKSPLCLV